MSGDHQLDIEQHEGLVAYLRASGRIAADEVPTVRTLSGGVSNRTVLLERAGGEAWVLKQALPKLRVDVEWYCSPQRIHREAIGMRWLCRLAPPGTITRFLFEDRTLNLLAMEAVAEPHENWKAMLLAGRLDTDHVEQFAFLLRAIHRNALSHIERLKQAFGDRSFFEALRLEPYYEYTATRVPQAREFLSRLAEETRARSETLVHGDYSPKNVLVRNGQLVLLDHEVAHLGDPAFDLGFSLAHLLSKAHHLPRQRAEFANAALLYWQAYEGERQLEQRAVCHTLACLLARVSGRSPLEYLDGNERMRQQRAVLSLLARPTRGITALVEGFVEEVSA
jgi:5-methylthioribose kinase